MVEVEKAINLVKTQGNPIQRARLTYILGEADHREKVEKFLQELQLSNGGFPYQRKRKNPYCLSVTSGMMKWMAELRLVKTPVCQRTIIFVKGLQHSEGFWDENPALTPFNPPFWDRSGELNTQLWITGAIAEHLIRLEKRIGPEVVRAGDFLLGHRKQDGSFQGFQHTTWLAIGVLTPRLGLDDVIIQTALKALEKYRDWEPTNLNWALNSLYWALVPPNHKVATKLLDMLKKQQRGDGSWTAEVDPKDKVSETLESLITLVQYGII